MEGWKSYLQDPAPGNSLIGANPQMGAEQIAFGIAQMKQYQLVTGGDAKTGGIGIIEPRLKKTRDMLVKNKRSTPARCRLSRLTPRRWSKTPE